METRNHDPSHPSAVPPCRQATDLVDLLAAIEFYVDRTGGRSRTLLARAAEALDDLHEELARVERLVAEQQDRLGTLYELLPRWGADRG